MRSFQLKILLSKATEIVRNEYTKSILKYQKKTVGELFKEKELCENDWAMFTGIILEEIFGEGFLCPLEETDHFFNLDVNHLNLTKYSSMIANAQLHDDLDLVDVRYNPKSSRIQIETPHQDVDTFNPTVTFSSQR
jgi:hypothetical protein